MSTHLRRHMLAAAMALPMLLVCSGRVDAQARGHKPTVEARARITLTVSQQHSIVAYYAAHRRAHAKPLPPGIRKRLARGKPLPPGIAKQLAPAALSRAVRIPDGYRLMEVGLSVVLVEVSTGIIRDLLRNVIR